MSIDVSGIVTDIKKQKGLLVLSKHVEFKLLTSNNKVVPMSYDQFLPIRKNDSLQGVCQIKNKVAVLTAPPFVTIATTPQHIIQLLVGGLAISFGEATSFYNFIVLQQVTDVFDYLTTLAEDWHHHRDDNSLQLLSLYAVVYNYTKLLIYWYKEVNLRQLYLLNITNKEIRHYPTGAKLMYNHCLINPYTVYTLPLDKCHSIVTRAKLVLPDNAVQCGRILRTVHDYLVNKQWMCIPSTTLLKLYPTAKQHLPTLQQDYHLTTDLQSVYMTHIHRMEVEIANMIVDLLNRSPLVTLDDPMNQFYVGKNNQWFIRYPAIVREGVSEDQKRAIQAAMDERFLLIQGLPGTGKTKIIDEIVFNYHQRNLRFLITSFTGKSIDRLREVVKSAPTTFMTMHRFIHGARRGLVDTNYDVIIIDEVSMVTTTLFFDFIKLFHNLSQIVLVGDVNQLPPIDHGSLLTQLLASRRIPTYQLTQNHRVAAVENDGILLNLHNMINHKNGSPFSLVETDNVIVVEGTMNAVMDIIQGCYDSGVSMEQLTIIAPYKKDVKALNDIYQYIYNEHSRSVVDENKVVWKEGDKVILCQNISTKAIYNGQQGKIVKVLPKSIIVEFNNIQHEFLLQSKYRKKKSSDDDSEDEHDEELTVNKLKLAYCLTTHKAQGSENDFIILYIDSDTDSTFLNVNMIYTMLSRAKKMVWVVTPTKKMIHDAVNRLLPYRCDNLFKRIQQK